MSGCVSMVPVHYFAWGSIMLLRRPWCGWSPIWMTELNVSLLVQCQKQCIFNVACRKVSVLGLRLYCIFAKPISEICRRYNFSHQSYADDTHVYLVIKPLDNWKNISRRLKTCLSDVSVWMSSTMLKSNQDKTELVVFAPKHRVHLWRKQMTWHSCEF